MPPLALIGVPSSAGARCAGQETAPAALRAAGLVGSLCAAGLEVADLGDLPTVSYRPDPDHPDRQNLPLVAAVARQTADRVDRALAAGRLPLVIGGDCSLSLGVIAGVLRHDLSPGLLYVDGDVDLNTPETSPSGVFEGMVLAHALGRGVPELAGIGPRNPLLRDEDVVLFGYDEESGWIDPPEIEALGMSHMTRMPQARVQEDPTAAARDALRRLQGRARLLVHFDIDVTRSPLADVPHPRGLDEEAAFAALRVFVGSSSCAAIMITEINPVRDPGGRQTTRLVEMLVDALTSRRRLQ